MLNLENFINYLLSGFFVTVGGIVAFVVFRVLLNYFSAYGKRVGLIRADFDYILMKEQIEKAVNKSKKIGDIEGKVEKLPELSSIQTALTEAVQKVEHGYWQEQQIEQLKREKLELLMDSLNEENQMLDDAHASMMQHLKPGAITVNMKASMYITLYFHHLESPYVEYAKHLNEYISMYHFISIQIWSNTLNVMSAGQVKGFIDQRKLVQDHIQILYDQIKETSKGLTASIPLVNKS